MNLIWLRNLLRHFIKQETQDFNLQVTQPVRWFWFDVIGPVQFLSLNDSWPDNVSILYMY